MSAIDLTEMDLFAVVVAKFHELGDHEEYSHDLIQWVNFAQKLTDSFRDRIGQPYQSVSDYFQSCTFEHIPGVNWSDGNHLALTLNAKWGHIVIKGRCFSATLSLRIAAAEGYHREIQYDGLNAYNSNDMDAMMNAILNVATFDFATIGWNFDTEDGDELMDPGENILLF